jgi:hypothetical protein
MSAWECYNGQWQLNGKPVKVAPVQITPYGNQHIPYEVAEEAYKEYLEQHGSGQSLQRLCERGGFSASEMAILLYDRIKRLERCP